MKTVDAQIDDILRDVSFAMRAENGHERKMYLQRIEIACKALVGQERVPDQGPWEVLPDGTSIMSDDFDHDVMLKVGGDFYGDADRRAYAVALANVLNGSKALPIGLPKTPPAGLLHSMAMRYRHDFGLDADDTSPMSCGMTPDERAAILRTMAQLYEEVAGHGFFKHPE
jgi:hypothetical protein